MEYDHTVYQCGLELSYRAGEQLRKDMLEAGLTEAEVDDVVEKAFAWRHESDVK